MPKVICLGEILIDRIAEQVGVDYDRVESWQSCPGGALANVACGLAKLGTSVSFIGCVGQDPEGEQLIQLLSKEGVNTTGLQVHPESVTRQIYVTRDEKGDRTFAKFSGDDTTVFADTLMSAEHLPAHLFADADFLVLGTLGLASPQTSRAIGRALKLAEDNFVRVIVDVNWRPMFWSNFDQAAKLIRVLLGYTDFLKLTTEEAYFLFRATSPAAIAQALNHLEGVIVTDGAKECRYYLGERQSKRNAFPIDAVDTTGAGDAFLAAFIHKISQKPLAELSKPEYAHDVISYACAAGAIATTSMGAIEAQPTDAQVRDFLAKMNDQ
ncbi:carbohydrate kinase [Tumidithrix elongata RA019]|uniref:Carbohydrate kinase n=1 Tax=Tumidithrix elongata BACA0141 TaxID=2716417 RepID=A0AAW9PUD8_9CYAN|nr:carbohydrate kinase [Tumidithrix elongata RA019]